MDIKSLQYAGEIVKKIRLNLEERVVEGVTDKQIIDYIEGEIMSNGCQPAFPATVCVNEEAAHYTYFITERTLVRGDVIKIDFGVSYEGWIADNAQTFEVGSEHVKELIEANKIVTACAVDALVPGKTLGTFGKEVLNCGRKYNAETIKNLTGHMIGHYNLHAGLSLPNYDTQSKKKIPEQGIFALEPFLTYGDDMIKDGGDSHILRFLGMAPIRHPVARKLLQTIAAMYPQLPFAKRSLLEKFSEREIVMGLRYLVQAGAIESYPKLVSRSDDVITQHEETVVLYNGEKYVITR